MNGVAAGAYTIFDDIPRGAFNLIMADPPWRFDTWSARGEGKSASVHYNCTGLDWIKSLPVGDLAARDCLLWLWATNPMLPQALAVVDAWGFTFKTAGTWAKLTRHGKQAFGTGYILRSACEPFLIATRGKPKTTRGVRSCVLGGVREHSRKPEEAFEAAERLMPDANRIEIFSREARPGWSAFGDEVGKFNQSDNIGVFE